MTTHPKLVIIAGSRGITDYAKVRALILECEWAVSIQAVISGTAPGVDRLGERWAREYGKSIIRMPADWQTNGIAAGYIRNVAMAKTAEGLIAIWDGRSHGTRNMIDAMNKEGKPVFIRTVTLTPKPGYKLPVGL
jgi:hypothetical protein